MVTQLRVTSQNLYQLDYHLWVQQTAKQLQDNEFSSLDLENLIEEILDLSERKKCKLESLLTQLLEHLLKFKYWDSERNYNQNHWKREIRNFRKQINKELSLSPSLKNYVQENFEECYQDARDLVADLTGFSLDILSVVPIGNLEQILDENWLPELTL